MGSFATVRRCVGPLCLSRCCWPNKVSCWDQPKRPGSFSFTPKTIRRKIGYLLTVVLMMPVCLSAQGAKNILILFEGNANHPANRICYEVFRGVFGSDQRNQIFEEYIDEDRLSPSDEGLEETLHQKYAGRKMDLIIGDGLPVLRFLLRHGEKLWPETSKVFYFVERRELPPTIPPDWTGVAMNLDYGATLDLALRLKPATRRAYYVGGVNAWETTWRGFAGQDFQRFRDRVEVTYLNNLPFPEMLDELGRLPTDSVVIYSELLRDVTGHIFVPARVCPLIASASDVPVFGPFDIYLGCGIVGGVMLDDKDVAEQTARLGVRVLAKGTASGFPIESSRTQVEVDWRQLQRWKINEASLPPGTVVRFRAPTLWEQYGWYVVAGVAAVVAQLALIMFLFIEMNRRKKSDVAVRNLSGRIINAGEEERKRIARELHDDIGQRLSLLSIGLEGANQKDGNEAHGHECWDDPLLQLDEIITDVHNLSHQLHSNKLQHLGLEAALKEVCTQLAKQHHIQIELAADNIQPQPPEEVALCFYRVAQEALKNAVKYSSSNRVEVRLAVLNGTLRMTVKDYGAGFDPSTAADGLGLATMRERLRLVGGQLLISTRPGEGTEITAQAKLDISQPQTNAA